MDVVAQYQRWLHFEIRRLVLIIGMVVAVILVFQSFALPYGKTLSVLLAGKGSMALTVGNATIINDSNSTRNYVALANDEQVTETYEDYDLPLDFEKNWNDSFDKRKDGDLQNDFTFKQGVSYGTGLVTSSDNSSTQIKPIKSEHGHLEKLARIENSDDIGNNQNTTGLKLGEGKNRPGNASTESSRISSREDDNLGPNSRTSKSLSTANLSLVGNVKQTFQIQPLNIRLPQTVSTLLNNNFTMADVSKFKRSDKRKISVSQMNSLLLQSQVSSHSVRPRWSSARDQELISAKLEIKNAPLLRNTPGLEASVFRNASIFIRPPNSQGDT